MLTIPPRLPRFFLSVLTAAGLFIGYVLNAEADPEVVWEGLATLVVHENLTLSGATYGRVSIRYDRDITEVINTPLPPETGFAGESMEDSAGRVRLIQTRIDRESDRYYVIDFLPTLGATPMFFIMPVGMIDDGRGQPMGLDGTEIVIPGDGFLYVSGYTDNTFDQRRKFRIADGDLAEVEQPFYYIGMESITTTGITLYADGILFSERSIVVSLPERSPVTVVLNRKAPSPYSVYLLKTPFGLTGWARFNREDLLRWNNRSPIEGLYYQGY